MRTLGWPYPLRDQGWQTVREWMAPLVETGATAQYLLDIIDIMIEHDRSDELAVTTSMFDLIVAARPVGDPPLHIVRVHAPDPRRPQGIVLIEDQVHHGRADSIQRPAAKAVPLFWRFVVQKLGVTPPGS